jgi:CheY-like chemotaxis protein
VRPIAGASQAFSSEISYPVVEEIRPGLPVVFSSGYALEMLAQQGRAAAKSAILIKPYRKAELAERLREVLTANSMAS